MSENKFKIGEVYYEPLVKRHVRVVNYNEAEHGSIHCWSCCMRHTTCTFITSCGSATRSDGYCVILIPANYLVYGEVQRYHMSCQICGELVEDCQCDPEHETLEWEDMDDDPGCGEE